MHRRTLLRGLAAGLTAAAFAPRSFAAGAASAHAFRFESLDVESGEIALADLAGSAVLIVNTASRCGFTPQYEGLQALWDGRRNRGLVVIGVPSRDFGAQEYADAAKIRDFCEVNFAIDFPMTSLTRVSGAEAHPFYLWARDEALGRGLPTPRWNFHKYLLAPDGGLAGAWGSSTRPDDPGLLAAIDALLAEA